MSEKNVTTEVVDMVLDSMPEPSPVADQILRESESESEPEPEPEQSGFRRSSPEKASVPELEWISSSPIEEKNDAGQAANIPPKSASERTGLRDVTGTEFDARYHATDDTGSPRKTASGKWRKKRGSVAPAPTVDANAVLAASLAIVTSIELLGAAIGGDEWKPEQSEHDMMVNAWRDYFMQVGAVEIPPYLGVIIATGAYAVPRVSKPQTSSTLVSIKNWFYRGWKWIYSPS